MSNPGLHLLGLTLLTLAIAFGALSWQLWVPVAAFGLVLVLGAFLLRPREMVLLVGLVAVGVAYVETHRRFAGSQVNTGILLLLVITAAFSGLVARSRARLGLQGTLGDAMLIDLRDRLASQGVLPPLPTGWHAESVLRSAYGQSFSGDFLVAARPGTARRLEVALVDVSGKGAAAGTHALLLSGAFGGLLGALPPEAFLAAANAYVLRQRWDEGFATAVHLDLDLDTGRYRLASAGHPPAAQFHAGSGRWTLTRPVGGPVLGVLPDAAFDAVSGRLEPGDALLLYTDGVVETPDRDLDAGIDRMLGHAERLVRDGFPGGARRIVDQARAGESDDRALMLIWRH
jgi:serine phosphatase RsbU (regulator of sigma subunit)